MTLRQRLLARAHGWTDHVVAGLAGRPRLFADGFGDRVALDRVVARVRDESRRDAPPVHVQWDGPWQARGRSFVRTASFRSPAAAILPAAAAQARIECLAPQRELGAGPACLLLAATGEEGFGLRRRLASGLVDRGVTVYMLENPLYGARRPPGQVLALVRTVAEQFAMNAATVEEAHAWLAWCRRAGHTSLGVSGYSQGGMMAAFAAAITPFAVAAIPRAAGASAGAIFTEDALARRFAWDRLAAELGDLARAKAFFAACLVPVDVTRFPAPVDCRAAILVASRHDRFIRADDVTRLHRHWPGSELRWLDAGHLTGAVMHGVAHRDAILDALARCTPTDPRPSDRRPRDA
jgi:hypothetical protein